MANIPYMSEAPEPTATSESMFGAFLTRAGIPEMKNLRFIMAMMRAMKSCVIASENAFSSPARKYGRGRDSILPMARYIRGTSSITELMSLLAIACCSFSVSSPRSCHWSRKEEEAFSFVNRLAPYPMPSTDFSMRAGSSLSSSYETSMLFESSETFTSFTPSRLFTRLVMLA